MKSFFVAVFALISFSIAGHANDVLINQVAKSVSGVDNLQNISIKNCEYVRGLDGFSKAMTSLGLNSQDGGAANALVRIPLSALPLQDGFQFHDQRGYDISYSNGTLTAQRKLVDDTFGGTDITTLIIKVSPDLNVAQSGSVKKVHKRFIFTKVDAEMTCQF